MVAMRVGSKWGFLVALQLAINVCAQVSVTTTVTECFTASSACSTSSSSTVTSSSTSTLPSTTLLPSTTTSKAAASGTVVVDAAGGAQFTAINQAISYAQTFAQPTVVVKAGVYNEAVTVVGTAQVTIVGESNQPTAYSQNQVTISFATTPMSIGTNGVLGITWRNINFVNTGTGTAAAVSLRGMKNAFYNCQFISSGATTVTSTLGSTIIANSYIEGTDKLFYGYNSLYIFGSTIASTASSSTIVYSRGNGSPIQLSQTVLDSCSIIQKPGTTNTYVYLAGPNGEGSQAVFKYTSIAGMIAPGGTRALGVNGFYGEYATTGPGSYAYDSKRLTTIMSSSMLSNWTVDYVFAHAFSGFSTSTTSWIDTTVAQAISSANVVVASSSTSTSSSTSSSSSFATSSSSQSSTASTTLLTSTSSSTSQTSTSTSASSVSSDTTTATSSGSSSNTSGSSSTSSTSQDTSASTSGTTSGSTLTTSSTTGTSTSSSDSTSSTSGAQSTTTASSSTASDSSTSSSTASSSSTLSSTSTTSTTQSSSTSSTSTTVTSPTATCILPASVPSTAFVVGPAGSCARYSNITSAIAALPVDSTTQYIYILSGVYTEQLATFNRVGATIFRGESSSPLSQSSNSVTLQYSGSVLSSSGGSEAYSVFRSLQYNAKKYAFYNINFVNIAAITPNYIAIAMDIKAQQVGFYSCGFTSGQGTFLANYGTFYLSGCRIEGSQDFIWGYGAAYISNSLIVSNTPGYSIAAQSYVATYPSQFVFDQCAFVPKTTTSMSQSTYLGRDYSVSARVAITNSFLDGHIYPAGWSIKSPSTANVTFVEYNNTGPGYVPASRATQAKILDNNSDYTVSKVLGDVSWIDSSAVVPFSGFPDSLFGTTTTSATTSATTTSTPTSTSASATVTTLAASSTFVVSADPNGTEFETVSAAINALPNDGLEKVIIIKPGTYTEQLNINRTGKVTLRGITDYANDYSQNQVKIQFNYGVSTSAGQNELTPVINSKKTDGSGLALYNIDFVNTFPQTRNYAALAADFYGNNMAAYGCSFVGFQDTLLANKGTQLFSNCYIEGSVDFIWGFSKAYFHQCYIAANTAGTSIAAQSRSSATVDGGYVFDSCLVTYTSTYGASMGLTYLGRPYSNFSVAVYKNSYLDKNINAAGWSVWQTSNPQTSNVLFGEYNNVGPSAWTSSTTRASFATNLTASQAAAYELGTFLGSTSWIDMSAYSFTPSFSFSATGVNSTATSATATSTASATASATAAANATSGHPSSGTIPPSGAVLVSVGGSVTNSFSNLTAALASLPQDTTSQTIFMYAGSYTEQVSVNRPGPVTVIGYQSGNVGQTYTGNQVTVTFARGLSVVAPVAAGHTNAETAVVATASTKIAFYNINFINTDNSDGAIASYVTLAASVYGDQIGYYGCSFVGWQDTLLTGNPSGYAYYESSYIEGAIDFIWGYSLSYFKGCTIGAKKAKSCVTAQSRASSSAVGGYIFDQCLFTAAPTSTVDLTQSVYIGRPYSQYAKVVVKYSYLDSTIQPAGWKAWSTTDTRLTSNTFFGEYQNSGPGNWENNTAARVAFGNATLLTSDAYTLSSVMASTSWIDMTYWNSIVTPQPAVITVPVTTTGNSTTPVTGACIVSKTAITGQTTYSTIAECIAQLPSTSAVATVFIYPGVYNEQLTFNRTGATIFRGYADVPGSYANNQVTITNSKGVDTQGDASNSDSATFYSRGKNVKFYNINLINTFGTAQDYASLGFAIGNNGNASFYGCQVIGNQDTFNINVGASVFTYNTYIEGSVDFIWGSGSAYFLSSTIAPNTKAISITADKRATNTSVGGFIFDQCKVTPSAAGASVAGISGSVNLGRPWNANARVAYIKTYLDSCVSSAGWVQWSSSSPNTNGVFFGEYQNTGPGSSTTSRASFSHQLSDTEAASLQLSNFFSSTSWIDFTALGVQPFSVVPSAPTVTITSTIAPTGSAPVVTRTSTASFFSTVTLPVSVTTKNITEKISTTILSTQADVYKLTTVTATTTSFSFVTPAVKLTTSTVNQIVSTTATVQGLQTTSTKTDTEKVTATITVTPLDVTKTQTETVSDVQLSTVTPKPVSQVITSLSTVTSVSTSTPKGKTTTVSSTATIQQSFTAAAPDVTSTQTSTSLTTSVKTSTPKGVTRTTTLLSTIPAGPTVTVAAKKAVTSYVSVTSTVTKTTKTTTTLSCTPAAVKAKRALIGRAMVKRQAGSSSSSSVGTSTVTVFYTLPQSTSTSVTIFSTSAITTVAALKSTETDTYTSYLYKTSVIPGQTFSSQIDATKIISKTTTLPVSTSTVTVDLQGTSVATVTIKGFTATETSTVFSTVKTSTSTAPGNTVSLVSTTTVHSTSVVTIPAETISTTVTAVRTVLQTTVLPTSTVTISRLATLTLKTTTTPLGRTQVVTFVQPATQLTTTTLPVSTVIVSRTSVSTVPTPSVTTTNTVVKTTTVKSTLTVTSTATKTPKNLPTCA